MQKRGHAVKVVILEAASRAFRDRGFRAASVDSIAKKAGVSKASIIKWEKTKGTLKLQSKSLEQLQHIHHEYSSIN